MLPVRIVWLLNKHILTDLWLFVCLFVCLKDVLKSQNESRIVSCVSCVFLNGQNVSRSCSNKILT